MVILAAEAFIRLQEAVFYCFKENVYDTLCFTADGYTAVLYGLVYIPPKVRLCLHQKPYEPQSNKPYTAVT